MRPTATSQRGIEAGRFDESGPIARHGQQKRVRRPSPRHASRSLSFDGVDHRRFRRRHLRQAMSSARSGRPTGRWCVTEAADASHPPTSTIDNHSGMNPRRRGSPKMAVSRIGSAGRARPASPHLHLAAQEFLLCSGGAEDLNLTATADNGSAVDWPTVPAGLAAGVTAVRQVVRAAQRSIPTGGLCAQRLQASPFIRDRGVHVA